MKKKLLWVLTFLPFLITGIALCFMDDRVALHYNMAGEADRYGSKYENFIFPVIIFFFTLFWLLLIRYFEKKAQSETEEKKREEAKSNAKIIYFTANGMALLFGIMQCFILFANIVQSAKHTRNLPIDMNIVVNVSLGIFMMVLGNYMPKTKRNSVIGVRTIWTLKNDEVWRKSNHLGGLLFLISGLLIILEAVLIQGIVSTFIAVGILLFVGVVVAIYSYYVYKQQCI